ncbi:hypothetical protein BRETT_000625 [Brettanomyces bruxellensis]|uniref:Zn(2)-C6 fungal-type domain-containing protein n=1 Tax=Dekkera bruxellensis TaxID=5007 RepID=A0A871REG1_DEKBR|nr:uncharacterized protein BRETT_000625 [Brettanomyces bruxellensis]QOU20911.1 hypothetical protein BRETT_000625 [Brettanomyces bruxellensis]
MESLQRLVDPAREQQSEKNMTVPTIKTEFHNIEPKTGKVITQAHFSGLVNTKIACLSCRDKKLKCDKKLPSCSRCLSKNIPCVYLSHRKTGPKPTTIRSKRTFKTRSSSLSKGHTTSDSTSPITTISSNGSTASLKSPTRKRKMMDDTDILQTEPTQKLPLLMQPPAKPAMPGLRQLNLEQGNNTALPVVSHNGNTPASNSRREQYQGTDDLRRFLSASKSESREDILGLKDVGLTIVDIDKFHKFYFRSNIRIFKYSSQRYYAKFLQDPASILHYSYMIWTISAFNLPEYESKVENIYRKGVRILDLYWNSSADTCRIDSLTYLHALCIKAQYEFLSGKEVSSALTICSAVRMAQMMGYDQIDISPNTLTTPTVFFKTFPGGFASDPCARMFASEFKVDDNLDPEIPLIEEKRRVFWEVYAIDKWYSLVTGLPCAFSIDSRSLICTKLPSPTTFLPLNSDPDSVGHLPANEQTSFYLHEAMRKLDKNQVLIDLNSSSSKILLLTISENIIKWCKMFLTIVELGTLRTDESLQAIRLKIDELVKNFENLQSNLLFFDLTTEPLMNIVINNTTTLLYQSVLLKLSSLFDLQFTEDSTGSNITETEKAIFTDILSEVSELSTKLVQSFIKKQRIEHHLKKAPVFIIFSNSLKSLLQCAAYVTRFRSILSLDPQKEQLLWNLINTTRDTISKLNQKQNTVAKVRIILEKGTDFVRRSPGSFSFFDSFLDGW